MANIYIAINKGQQEGSVTEDTSTQSKDIELNIDDSNAPTREDVLLALSKFRDYVLNSATIGS